MSNPLSVTDPGIQAVLTAFNDAQSTTNSVQQRVNEAKSMRWTGDASTTYRNSMDNWLDGLRQVEAGLQQMNDAMTQHRTATNNAESTNNASSSWYR
jgi:WXG100 family type VII secretion target